MTTQLWVGLGNPGAEYAMHRHNVGFMAVDAIVAVHGFASAQKKFLGWLHEGRLGAQKVLLLKPATFMNDSGRSVGEAMRFYKLEPAALTVFHDELDLAAMKVKVRVGGGLAGHNGLRSIDRQLGADPATGVRANFRRVRIGIGHPGHKDRVTGHVLGHYARSELDALADMLGAIAAEAPRLAEGDDTRFMNDVALRLRD